MNRFVESQPQIQNSRSNRRSTAVFNSSTYFTHRRPSFNVRRLSLPRSHIKRCGQPFVPRIRHSPTRRNLHLTDLWRSKRFFLKWARYIKWPKAFELIRLLGSLLLLPFLPWFSLGFTCVPSGSAASKKGRKEREERTTFFEGIFCPVDLLLLLLLLLFLLFLLHIRYNLIKC